MSGNVTHPSIYNVEFLTRLTTANNFFQAAIRKRVPAGLVIRDRANKVPAVGPEDGNYEPLHRRFTAEVSDANTIHIFEFLYNNEIIFKDDFELFAKKYEASFSDRCSQWKEIRSDHPRLYQTTVSYLLTGKNSDTLVSSRLEDLERIGLVARSDTRPPRPKHVNITPAGIEVLEAAIEEAHASLRPIFTLDMVSFPPLVSPQPCASGQAPEPGLPLEANKPGPNGQRVDKPK